MLEALVDSKLRIYFQLWSCVICNIIFVYIHHVCLLMLSSKLVSVFKQNWEGLQWPLLRCCLFAQLNYEVITSLFTFQLYIGLLRTWRKWARTIAWCTSVNLNNPEKEYSPTLRYSGLHPEHGQWCHSKRSPANHLATVKEAITKWKHIKQKTEHCM